MIENVQAVYKNGVLHPLKPFDLSKDKIVEIEVHDVLKNAEKIKAFDNWMNSLNPNTPNLTDEQISRKSIYD